MRTATLVLLAVLVLGACRHTRPVGAVQAKASMQGRLGQPVAGLEGAHPPIAPGQSVSGRLASSDPQFSDRSYYDLYRFDAQQGRAYTFTLTSSDFDALVLVLDPQSGRPVALNDDMEGSTNAQLTWMAPRTGTFLVAANTYQPADATAPGPTGAYRLSMREGGEAMPDGALSVAQIEQQYATGGDPKGRYAVLVGISDYPGSDNDLPQSARDIRLVRQLLLERYGFRERDIVMIEDRAATRERIAAAVRRHLGQAGPDGVAVFYYSGHGQQMDANLAAQDDEPDGKDEAISVWSQQGTGAPLLDDELSGLIESIRAQRTLFILDACHSGTGTRGEAGSGAKLLSEAGAALQTRPSEWLPEAATGAEAASTDTRAAAGMRHVLMAAAASDELAWGGDEWPDTGAVSVFTYFLYKNAVTAGPGTTVNALMNRVRAQAVRFTRDNRTSVQTPQVEGRAGTLTLTNFFAAR